MYSDLKITITYSKSYKIFGNFLIQFPVIKKSKCLIKIRNDSLIYFLI